MVACCSPPPSLVSSPLDLCSFLEALYLTGASSPFYCASLKTTLTSAAVSTTIHLCAFSEIPYARSGLQVHCSWLCRVSTSSSYPEQNFYLTSGLASSQVFEIQDPSSAGRKPRVGWTSCIFCSLLREASGLFHLQNTATL